MMGIVVAMNVDLGGDNSRDSDHREVAVTTVGRREMGMGIES
jgi:hypothetical protein